MFPFHSVILFTFIISLIAFLPIPGLPVILLNYKTNGIFGGFVSAYLGGTISALIQYFFSRKLIYGFHTRSRGKKFFRKILIYSNKIKYLSSIELATLMLSAIPSILVIPACGIANIRFRKFILCFLLTSLPYQLLFVLTSFQAQKLEKIFSKYGFNLIETFLMSIGTYSLIIFVLLLLFKKLKKEFL